MFCDEDASVAFRQNCHCVAGLIHCLVSMASQLLRTGSFFLYIGTKQLMIVLLCLLDRGDIGEQYRAMPQVIGSDNPGSIKCTASLGLMPN